MIILGIDPGTAIMGYGLVESGAAESARDARSSARANVSGDNLRMMEYGALHTPANAPLFERLPMLYKGIADLLAEYKPDGLALEQLFFNRNVSTALSVGHARGVVILAAAHAGVPVSEYTPLQVKQAVVGYGRATKEQVQAMVKVLLNMDHIPRPDDAADALAVAICHIHSQSFAKLVSGE
jgi:crossover junction endodeoxyribonuclease RuvC